MVVSFFLYLFKTPGIKRPRAKPKTGIDNFDQGVIIKRCIHSFHITEKELPTVENCSKKSEMQAWLTEKGIDFSENM